MEIYFVICLLEHHTCVGWSFCRDDLYTWNSWNHTIWILIGNAPCNTRSSGKNCRSITEKRGRAKVELDTTPGRYQQELVKTGKPCTYWMDYIRELRHLHSVRWGPARSFTSELYVFFLIASFLQLFMFPSVWSGCHSSGSIFQITHLDFHTPIARILHTFSPSHWLKK